MPPRKKAAETEPESTTEETPAVEPEADAPEADAPEADAPEASAPEADPTGTPVDLPDAVPLKPAPPVPAPSVYGATFAERRAAREGKQVTSADAENKAVQK